MGRSFRRPSRRAAPRREVSLGRSAATPAHTGSVRAPALRRPLSSGSIAFSMCREGYRGLTARGSGASGIPLSSKVSVNREFLYRNGLGTRESGKKTQKGTPPLGRAYDASRRAPHGSRSILHRQAPFPSRPYPFCVHSSYFRAASSASFDRFCSRSVAFSSR
jgi:hypothetical protein